jgi:hypothetical protein
MKSSPILPLFVASAVVMGELLGPHEPHVELNLQEEGPQLVGMLASNVVSTATATVLPLSSFGWRDFQ